VALVNDVVFCNEVALLDDVVFCNEVALVNDVVFCNEVALLDDVVFCNEVALLDDVVFCNAVLFTRDVLFPGEDNVELRTDFVELSNALAVEFVLLTSWACTGITPTTDDESIKIANATLSILFPSVTFPFALIFYKSKKFFN